MKFESRHIVLLAAALMASCAKEIIPQEEVVTTPSVTFTATVVSGESQETRTVLSGDDDNGYDVVWTAGDGFRTLYSYGKQGSYWGFLGYNISSAPGSASAEFATGDSFVSDYHEVKYSLYPASMVPDDIYGKSAAVDGDFLWPAEQEYRAGTAYGCPMYSMDTDPSGVFRFKNLGGVLRLRVKGSGRVTSVMISAAENLSGPFFLMWRNSVPEVGFYYDAQNQILLNCPGDGVQLNEDEGVDFHFNLPAGKYTDFEVSFYDGDVLLGRRKAKKAVEIERSMISTAPMTLPTGSLAGIVSEYTIPNSEILSFISGISPAVEQYAAFLPFLVTTDLHVASVLYTTRDVDGKMIKASGLIAYPTNADASLTLDHIVSIQHGTCDIDEAPSGQRLPMELLPTAVGTRDGIFSTPSFFVACMADYLGYGATENDGLLHPYLHDRLAGSCCADLISATEQYIEEKELALSSDMVDLVGYSQGGAATISTMLELLDRDSETWSLRLGSINAGAGPYDIPEFMNYFADKESYSHACYIPFALRGLAYGAGLDIDWNNVYAANVGGSGKNGSVLEEELFSRTQVSTWNDVIGTDVRAILNPDFYEAGYGDNGDILALVNEAQRNSVANRPAPGNDVKAKIHLYHSLQDNTVPYACSESLRTRWGLGDITLLGHSDHVEAGVDFILNICGLGALAAVQSSQE